MLDFGWPELFLIIAVAIIVIGPNEIPAVMIALGRIFRRFQYIKFAISQQFEDVMRDADLDDIRRSVNFEAKDDVVFDEAAADDEYDILPAEELAALKRQDEEVTTAKAKRDKAEGDDE